MANIFVSMKKKPKTEKEYLQIFEELIQSFEILSDKADLFKKIINGLDLNQSFFFNAKESTASAYCGLIQEKIGRELTQSEGIKTEIMVNAHKSKFIGRPTRGGGIRGVLVAKSTLKRQYNTRRNMSKGWNAGVMKKNTIRKKR